MASIDGNIILNDAVEIRVLEITKNRFWHKRKVLIETRVGNDSPTTTWFEIGDEMKCRVVIVVEDM